MRFVARHALATFVTFSMKSVDTFISNSDTFFFARKLRHFYDYSSRVSSNSCIRSFL